MIPEVDQPCVVGRTHHDFIRGSCLYCGATKPGTTKPLSERKIDGRTREGREARGTSRPTSTSKTSRLEPAFNKKEAHDGIVMLLAVGQSLLIARAPELKEDALTPRERALLADALAEEATQSTTLHRWMAKVGKQKKHAKLGMVLTAIMLPRLARHGIIPSEGMEEVREQLVTQLETSSSTGFSGSPPSGSEVDWDSVPVAAGGSPFANRGNGFGEIDPSGVVAETAPLRGSPENENGRDSMAGPSGGEIPRSNEEPPAKPDRATSRSKTSGQAAS